MPQRPQPVAPGVFVVGGPAITDPADCLVYAVDGGTEVALIDCGAGASALQILRNLEEVGLGDRPLGLLVLTHRHVDHVGGAPAIVDRASPRVACHALDAGALVRPDPVSTASSWYGVRLPPIPVDPVLEGEEGTIPLGGTELRWIHTPGHTPGSIAVYVDTPAGRVAFAQDVHGPFLPEFGSDLDRWTASMERLLALRPDVLCEGHYGVLRPRDRVERFVRDHLRAQGYGGGG